jgi:hypothetical protein
MTCQLVEPVNNNNTGQTWKTLYRHHSDDLSSLENLNELFLLPNQILRHIFIHTRTLACMHVNFF